MAKLPILLMLATLMPTGALAQQTADNGAFHTYIYNKEYKVFMRLNLYDNDVLVPGQEIFGTLPGYLQKEHTSYTWMITNAELASPTEAQLTIVNDYGSEDLTATLVQTNDSTYELRQKSGSTLKVPNNGKWQKLPKTLELTRKK